MGWEEGQKEEEKEEGFKASGNLKEGFGETEKSRGRKASQKKSRFPELDWLDDEPEEGIEDEEDLGEEGGWDNWILEDVEPGDEGKNGRQENQNTGKEEAGKENRP